MTTLRKAYTSRGMKLFRYAALALWVVSVGPGNAHAQRMGVFSKLARTLGNDLADAMDRIAVRNIEEMRRLKISELEAEKDRLMKLMDDVKYEPGAIIDEFHDIVTIDNVILRLQHEQAFATILDATTAGTTVLNQVDGVFTNMTEAHVKELFKVTKAEDMLWASFNDVFPFKSGDDIFRRGKVIVADVPSAQTPFTLMIKKIDASQLRVTILAKKPNAVRADGDGVHISYVVKKSGESLEWRLLTFKPTRGTALSHASLLALVFPTVSETSRYSHTSDQRRNEPALTEAINADVQNFVDHFEDFLHGLFYIAAETMVTGDFTVLDASRAVEALTSAQADPSLCPTQDILPCLTKKQKELYEIFEAIKRDARNFAVCEMATESKPAASGLDPQSYMLGLGYFAFQLAVPGALAQNAFSGDVAQMGVQDKLDELEAAFSDKAIDKNTFRFVATTDHFDKLPEDARDTIKAGLEARAAQNFFAYFKDDAETARQSGLLFATVPDLGARRSKHVDTVTCSQNNRGYWKN